MPNQVGSNGIVTASQAELLALYTAGFQAIYGAGVNLGAQTPDGQQIGISIQAILDLEDLITQVYNGFDPDNAIGVVLDQRVAINGIQRLAGTFTVTNITVTTSTSVNLYGLDQTVNPVYTVADNAGTQWQLQTTQLGVGPGALVLAFQAASPGETLTTPNTITVPVSIVLGVTDINNPSTYTTLGVNEESDANLRIRRQQSVALPSQGYLQGLLAALKNIPGVSYADVIENDTGATDANGVPGHSIWVLVAGTGAPVAIANAIYVKRNAGAGMFGAQSFAVLQVDGTFFTVRWDDVLNENLFIKFTANSINGTTPPNIAAIRNGLPTLFLPGVGQSVNISTLGADVQALDSNTYITSAGFSTTSTGSYTSILAPTSPQYQFVTDAANIIILPMQLTPATSKVPISTSLAFLGLGGYGAYTYSFQTNNSGGTVNSSTGAYVSGTTPSVTDTILVTDSLSNTATATVVVS